VVGKKGPRKLLVASVGLATINYVLIGCDTFGTPADEQPGSPDFFTGMGGKVSGPGAKGGGPPVPPFPTSGNLPTPMPMGGFAGFGGFAGQNVGGAAGGGMGGGGADGGGAGGMAGMNAGDGGQATGGDASGGDGAGGAEGTGGDDASGGDGAGGGAP
jgi:hypothetical protein